MNTYTAEELKDLAKAIDQAHLIGGSMNTPESAVNNICSIIEPYLNDGTEAVREKLYEYAKIGEMISTEFEKAPVLIVYNLIYEVELEEIPLYINSEYAVIAQWRLNLPKAPMV